MAAAGLLTGRTLPGKPMTGDSSPSGTGAPKDLPASVEQTATT
jgi:hypothetical protein